MKESKKDIRDIIEYDRDEDEIIQRSYLELETLLMNILGSQEVVVINDDLNRKYEGTESIICLKKKSWLSKRVNNIYIEDNKIIIHIDNDKYIDIDDEFKAN